MRAVLLLDSGHRWQPYPGTAVSSLQTNRQNRQRLLNRNEPWNGFGGANPAFHANAPRGDEPEPVFSASVTNGQDLPHARCPGAANGPTILRDSR